MTKCMNSSPFSVGEWSKASCQKRRENRITLTISSSSCTQSRDFLFSKNYRGEQFRSLLKTIQTQRAGTETC